MRRAMIVQTIVEMIQKKYILAYHEDKWDEFANDFSVQVYNNKEDYRKNSLIISALLAILGGVATYFISGHALKTSS